MQRPTLSVVAIGALLLAGCEAEPAGPSDSLSPAEVAALAPQTSELGSSLLDLVALGSGAFVQLGGRSGTDFTRTHPCPRGGEVRVAGSSTITGDRAAGSWTVQQTATKTLAACAFNTRDGELVQQDGSLSIQGTRSVVQGRLSGPQTTTQRGTVRWTRGTQSGSCDVDLSTAFDPATRTATVRGSYCGRAVDRTHTLGARG